MEAEKNEEVKNISNEITVKELEELVKIIEKVEYILFRRIQILRETWMFVVV